MTSDPAEKHGRDFLFEDVPLGGPDSGQSRFLKATVGITPEKTPEATLRLAWETARDLARWLLDRSAGSEPRTYYQIIVGWSRSVREDQGEIFNLSGDADRLRLVNKCASYLGYETVSPGKWIPLWGWEEDVFADPSKKKIYHAMILNEAKDRIVERVTIEATTGEEARRLLEEEHGKGRVFSCYNPEDSEKLR